MHDRHLEELKYKEIAEITGLILTKGKFLNNHINKTFFLIIC